MSNVYQLNRRQWLGAAAGSLSLAVLSNGSSVLAAPARPKVAAVITEFTYRSHAHVLLENFLEPYLFNGKVTESGMDVVSMYVDQFPEGRDMARDIGKQYGIEIFPTIAGSLTRGGKDLAVDAVLSIGEHGKYPVNQKGQMEYPRKRFFDEIAAVMRKSGRSVPVFNDKHLSYRWDWSVEMMQTARELKIPFMAGSSVPLAQRRPPFELPSGAKIEEAVSIHGGGLESYDFHAMEVLQSMVEARQGGETGVAEIQVLEGDEVWKAAEQGRWSLPLAEAAMKAAEGKDVGPLRSFAEPGSNSVQPIHIILITYRDGMKGTIVRIGASAIRWCFACRVAGNSQPLATSFYVGPWHNRNLFKALSHAIQAFFRTGVAPYPVERTHLVTGMLDAAMDSHFEKNRLLKTPQLDVVYKPTDYGAYREMGDSWKIVTEDIPEPKGMDTRKGKPR